MFLHGQDPFYGRRNVQYAIVSCSHNPQSRSRNLATHAWERMKKGGFSVEVLDLASYSLPFCDGATSEEDPVVLRLQERLWEVDGFLIAAPIYNYDVNAACKNFIEVTGRKVWTDKVVAFVAAAGGQASYMSAMGLLGSLMLDFRTYIVPRFVYAIETDFDEQGVLMSDDVRTRVERMVDELTSVTPVLRQVLVDGRGRSRFD